MTHTSNQSRNRGTRPLVAICTAIVAAAALQACGGGHELDRYSFAGTTLALVDRPAPSPEVRTGAIDAPSEDALGAVLDVGSRAAKEFEARRAEARLDSAAAAVGVRDRISAWSLERAARYLGARPVPDPVAADYLLEMSVRGYGIDARSGRTPRLFMRVEGVLIERRTGHEVWSVQVDTQDELSPAVRTASTAAVDVVTAGRLHTLSVEELRSELASLTEFTADYLTNELRKDLREIRSR